MDGKNYIVTTNSAGEWSLNYIPTYVGSFDVQVSYIGNDAHYGFINFTTFNVDENTIIPNNTTNTTSGNNGTENPKPTPTPIPTPNTAKDTNKINNNPTATTAMKKTGMPIIAILLVLLSVLVIVVGKKRE